MSRWPRAHIAIALLAALALLVVATSTRQRHAHPRLRAAYVHAGHDSLRYVRAGRGPTVVLLHGFGESLIAWRGVFDLISGEADVVALDLPGFGLSTKRATGYATDSLAADVVAALRALGISRTVLVGHSMGGAIAAAAALAAPDLVRALVLLDPAVVGATITLPDTQRSRLLEAARGAIATYEAQRTRFTSPHDPQWLAESAKALAYLPAGDSAYRAAVAAVLREFDFASLPPERAGRLAMPTLVLWGELDPLFAVDEGRRMSHTLPRARFEVVSRSWHRPHVERPAKTAALLSAFLLEIGPDSGLIATSP